MLFSDIQVSSTDHYLSVAKILGLELFIWELYVKYGTGVF